MTLTATLPRTGRPFLQAQIKLSTGIVCYTGCAIKKRSLRKNSLYLRIVADFFAPNLQCLQRGIQATYPANFITISGLIKKL